ncbi:MAG: triose-phosphate isomerase [Longimicrobiales bacterium]|jgi:triosephosphate isomerase|nr:triose-phosphate isomerase [Longimicrobiales bacterium]
MAVIAGNWKMHLGPAAALGFLSDFEIGSLSVTHELIVFPPTASLHAVASSDRRDARLQVGVQNIYWEDAGAFTGETSAPMAADAGASFALVGHSERRHVFGESDEDTRRKVEAAVRANLVPVLCVGETLEERRAGRVEAVILRQLDAALGSLRAAERFLVAYEPVWAIGTGETATPADAASAHGTLRARLAEAMGVAPSATVPILYGGSVKPANAAELMSAADVDGVLVGGASLDAASFREIAVAAG